MAWTSELACQEIWVPWLQHERARLQHNANAQCYNSNLKSFDTNGQGYNANTNGCPIPQIPNPNVHPHNNEDNTSCQSVGTAPPVNGGGLAEATNVAQVAQRKRRHVAGGRNEVPPPEEVAQTWDLDGTHLWLFTLEYESYLGIMGELRYIGTEYVSRRVLVHSTALLRFSGDFTTVFEPITSDLHSSDGDIDVSDGACRVCAPSHPRPSLMGTNGNGDGLACTLPLVPDALVVFLSLEGVSLELI
ncbi:hypothetical protein DFH07DRAFT_769927 [Mycena maculata]|uniref:Uncharacterized protein n=1 Tax=Mycena maculata TaxID=230809 RepID=A0AAD7NLP1_9AGAR|nr:hypothetical protein DFH07DRAFT_769927 [Mycena maculata]